MSLLQSIYLYGGLTVDSRGETFTSKKGFQVGKIGFKIPVSQSEDVFNTMVSSLLMGMNENEYLGFWIDDDFIYIDYCIYVKSYVLAYIKGLFYNQKAIFKWETKRVITL